MKINVIESGCYSGILLKREGYVHEYNFCETCGDCDTHLGYVETEQELIEMLEEELYTQTYITEKVAEFRKMVEVEE